MSANEDLKSYEEEETCDQCHEAVWVVGPPAVPSRLCGDCAEAARALGLI